MKDKLEFTQTAVKPIGKRSDPDWAQNTIFLKKDSVAAAKEKLKSEYGKGKTMSDLIEALLQKWLRE